ncbi:uncharacterized protein [Cardiocondyla obscurior]|uniref:uncharacterized protein n=1 Tax=Cardiocondyla obscurior TaxID=286306 RepID=UPI003965895F
MYRQILVDASQTKLQRILWRGSECEAIQEYELLTVTYGTTSAPFLATRVLKHLAESHESEFPVGAKRITRDFYMDNLLTGADTLDEAITARDQIIAILRRGKLELSKWLSNHVELLPREEQGGGELSVLTGEGERKILGIQWDPSKDEFIIEAGDSAQGGRIIKRTVLAEIAGLFEPLGVLEPLIVVSKLVLQKTWQAEVGWDETLPPDLHQRWVDFRVQLRELKGARIPHWVGTKRLKEMQVHGFCDASERAYGACIYVRVTEAGGRHRVALLTSKSRVAPVRAVSLPRLKLSAALLLARLLERIRTAWEIGKKKIVLWSDSTIMLQWIKSSSQK